MDVSDVLEALPLPCVAVGEDDRITAVNPAAAAIFGAEIAGRGYGTVFRQPALLGRIEAARGAVDGAVDGAGRGAGATDGDTDGAAARRPCRIELTREGQLRVFDVTVTAIGGPGHTLLAFEDVSTAARAGEMRSEFVANVSHELRTPLTAISGFIETLRGPAKDDAEARAAFLEIMEREARRMNRLVDDLLSLARVEDMERLRPEGRVEIAALLRGVVASFQGRARERAVVLVLSGDTSPRHLPGDPDQLTQVFTNLVENALKYGASGGEVTIALSTTDHDPRLRGPGVLVAVRDRGEGIDDRHLGRLTERFYRVDSHRARDMGGTGLGLAIVKHILKRHRGQLRITSRPGEGATFEVALPLR